MADKFFPLVLAFLYLGPFIGLLVAITASQYAGFGILGAWACLCLTLITGAWQ